MEELNFNWRMKGLAKGVSPSIAAEEIKRLQELHGAVTPEILVEEARKRRSPLHPIFEWDDTKAAYNYRLQQARTLLNNIQVTIISDGEPRKIDCYEVTTRNEGYKSIDTFTPNDVEFVRDSCMKNLSYWKEKLRTYKEFDKVRELLEQAILVMNN